MPTMKCSFCHQSIKDVSLNQAFNWLETHKCPKNPENKKKANKKTKDGGER